VVSVVRVHTYCVDPDDLDELITRRATLIESVRSVYPGLVDTRLLRHEDGTYTDAWQWESMQALVAAFPAAGGPQAEAAMKLTRNATATNAELVDQR
jgi:hypothetical protein